MGQEYERSDMPPLTEDMHATLRSTENVFRNKLASCCHDYRVHDEGAAIEYVRTYAVTFFNCFYEFYSEYPKYRDHWAPASEAFALQRVVKCIEDVSTIHSFFKASSIRMIRIKNTLSECSASKVLAQIPKVQLMAPPSETPWASTMSPLSMLARSAAPIAKTLLNPRKLLFNSYRRKFPEAGILDICWAAKQTYRELQRWLKGQSRDGSKPDRLFRAALESDKAPSQLRREPRPKNWK